MPKNAFAFKTLNFDSTSLQLHTKHETSREEDKVLKTLKKHVTRVNAARFFSDCVETTFENRKKTRTSTENCILACFEKHR